MLHISVRTTDQRVMQFGVSIGDMDGCDTVEVDDALLDTLQQPGIKTLEADGTISVTPDLEAQAAEQARQQAIADAAAARLDAVRTIIAFFPTAGDKEKAALALILGLPQQ